MLLLTIGALMGLDSYFFSGDRIAADREMIAELVKTQGDVRVRYKEELQWKTSHRQEKLLYDDAVFSGANSQADLRIGQSELTLNANTLVVLRRDMLFRSLNLNYGSISGILAKGERFMIESNGEKFELSATVATKVIIESLNGKTVVRVLDGHAELKHLGETVGLSSRDTFVVAKKPAKTKDNLIFEQPTRSIVYAAGQEAPVQFQWKYASGRPAEQNDIFTLEISPEPSFQHLVGKETVQGAFSFAGQFPVPAGYNYRLKDGNGNLSESRRITLIAPQMPVIESPRNASVFETRQNQIFTLPVRVSRPQPESHVVVQVAATDDFATPLASKTTLEPNLSFDLAAGEYYLRARAEFQQTDEHGDPLKTEWTAPLKIAIREKVEKQQMQTRFPGNIIIPNMEYPANLYSAGESEVQTYLSQTPQFSQFFKRQIASGSELVLQRGRTDELPVRQKSAAFPKNWIKPGLLFLSMRLERGGKVQAAAPPQHLRIEMEAPKNLSGDGAGKLHWSRVLFAKNYEGELIWQGRSLGKFLSRAPQHQAKLRPGAYAFRVRALDENAAPISAWSAAKEFAIAEPMPAPQQMLTKKDEPAKTERKPAQQARSEKPEGTSQAKGGEKESIWHKAGYWLWAGSGFNYFDVRQTVSNTAQVEYHNTKGPSMFVEAGYMSHTPWGAVVSYKRTPGDVRLDNYPLSNRSFVWDTISAEGLLALPWKMTVWHIRSHWGLRGGVQHHSFPFLYVESGNTVVQSTSTMTAASLGFYMETEGRWKQHWHMRYQQPVRSSTSSGNTFEVQPTVAFDGSVGTSYMLTDHWKTGLFWYGQLHAYDFTYRTPTQTNTGKQSLFYSNMEFRLGVDF